ncbi:MAG TPA: VanZ family protein [Bdellovibrionota bacterium]|nr:VanZ family protein [Bdellovibrionota bacterium]
MKKNIKLWVPVIFWCGLIFFLSHRPVPENFSESQTFSGIDIIYHILAYTPLAFLVYRAKKNFLFTVVFVALYGLSDEIHQYCLPYRSFEVVDLISDSMGGVIGGVIGKKEALGPLLSWFARQTRRG